MRPICRLLRQQKAAIQEEAASQKLSQASRPGSNPQPWRALKRGFFLLIT